MDETTISILDQFFPHILCQIIFDYTLHFHDVKKVNTIELLDFHPESSILTQTIENEIIWTFDLYDKKINSISTIDLENINKVLCPIDIVDNIVVYTTIAGILEIYAHHGDRIYVFDKYNNRKRIMDVQYNNKSCFFVVNDKIYTAATHMDKFKLRRSTNYINVYCINGTYHSKITTDNLVYKIKYSNNHVYIMSHTDTITKCTLDGKKINVVDKMWRYGPVYDFCVIDDYFYMVHQYVHNVHVYDTYGQHELCIESMKSRRIWFDGNKMYIYNANYDYKKRYRNIDIYSIKKN